MPQIRVLLGYQQGQVFSLDRAVVIGRDPHADIVLHPDSPASRRHAEIVPSEAQWRVRDLGSVNGTLLNGQLAKDEVLGDMDEVVIGENVFVFENKDSDAAHIAEAASHVNLIESRGFPNRPEVQALVHAMSQRMKDIEKEVGKVYSGKPSVIRDIVTAIISEGHVLLTGSGDGVKAKLSAALSEVIGLKSTRIEFAPDLAPDAITGSDVVQQNETTGKQETKFVQGPIFTQVLVAEEVTRAHPGSEAVLMEVMQEHRVTVAGRKVQVEPPFIVIATLSPIEREDAVPLSESQLDRFMFSVEVAGESAEGRNQSEKPVLVKILKAKQILELHRAMRELPVNDHVVKYAVRLVRSTRPSDKRAPEFIRKYIHSGAGPRAAQDLVLGAKAHAVMEGHLSVTIADVRAVARPTLRHRIFTNFTAESAGLDADKIIERLVAEVEEPGVSEK